MNQRIIVKLRAPASQEGDFVLISDRTGALRVTVPYSDKLRQEMGSRLAKYHAATIVDGKLELGAEINIPPEQQW
jgi:hypothetical protein